MLIDFSTECEDIILSHNSCLNKLSQSDEEYFEITNNNKAIFVDNFLAQAYISSFSSTFNSTA